MGLIKAFTSATATVTHDQWREYFYCDAIPANVLVVKGTRRNSSRSYNQQASDNIVSNGSIIAVADGQCMMIVDQGQIVEFTAEPGEFTYDASTEPSVFYGGLGKGILKSFAALGKRFTFGGEIPKDQRIYFFNTKELYGNKYGTPNPVPFRVVDKNSGIDMDISIRCFGEYSYRICDPLLFYKNVCGNISEDYTRDRIDSQLKTELMTALQPAFGRISEMGIRYSGLVSHTMELAQAMNDVLSPKWRELRGLEIVSMGVSSVTASEEDEAMLKEIQKSATMGSTPKHLLAAQAEAMKMAASNKAGAMMGFMGLNLAQQVGNASAGNFAQLYQMDGAGNQAASAAPAGAAHQAAPANSWKCSCGATATGNFCPQCGSKRPEAVQGWTCACGHVNKGKFCTECGKPKPAGVPQYRCDKCGWEPADPAHPPKFCPECGDPFGDEDAK